MWMRRIATLVCSLLVVLAVPQAARTAAGLPAVPRGLPRHFAIGLSAEPDATGIYGWMPNTHIPFDYAYTYLAGGVNTGGGWETWNSNARFPLLYARGAHQHGYIPVFPYYMLRQSHGPCDACPEAHVDLANLNSVVAVQTEDMGVAHPGGGFTLLGRAPGAVLRGCSLTAEDLFD